MMNQRLHLNFVGVSFQVSSNAATLSFMKKRIKFRMTFLVTNYVFQDDFVLARL